MSQVMALRASGRLKVTTPTDPLMSQARLLDGIVVLDTTQVMAGPYCAMLLADMGARVIKVEPPAGDSTRAMAGAIGSDSAAFNAVNRGKLGIVLDLAKPQAVDAFKRLARTRGHPDRKLPAGRDDAPGPRLRRAVGGEPAADLRVDLGLRADRPVGDEGRLRPDRAGRVRHHVGHRRPRRSAGEGRGAAHRSRRRVVCRRSAFSARCTTARPPAAGSTSTPRSPMPGSRCRCGKSPTTSPPARCPARSARRTA